MAPPDGGLHIILIAVHDIWSTDVSVGFPATGDEIIQSCIYIALMKYCIAKVYNNMIILYRY